MRQGGIVLTIVAVVGCSGPSAAPIEPAPVDSGSGACGEVSRFDLVLRGWAQDVEGVPVAGALIRLEERAWTPGSVHGQDRTDADGRFEILAAGLPDVEDCWGTALQYWLAGEATALAGDKLVNNAILSGLVEGDADIDMTEALILRPE